MSKRYQTIIAFLVLMLGGSLIAAENTGEPFKQGHPEKYIVKKGDTLWGIADTFLKDPWKWPEIWHANEYIVNPHLIYPGDVIKLVYVQGRPRLTVQRPQGGDQGGTQRSELPDGTIKLSPRSRVSKLDSVIPAIPLDVVQSFLVDNRVVGEEELDGAPYVVAGGDAHLLMGSGDKFYVRGLINSNQSAFGIYRKGKPYIDPDTKELLGWEAQQLGLSKLIESEREISTLRLLSSNKDIRIGDRLLPTLERKVDSVFYPKSPKVDVEGRIIHVFGGVRNVSQYNVTVLNRGERDQLSVGDVLAIYREGERVRDRKTSELLQLPSERAGLLIIFRTFEKVSFGLVVKAQKTLKVLDIVKNP